MNIIKIKKNNNKYVIYFDDIKLITYDNIIIKYNLLYKKKIDEDLYNIILKDNEYYELYNKVISLISKKIRSKNEIKNYLLKQTNNIDYINKIIEELVKNNLLNDYNYIYSYIQDKIYLSNDGPNKIKYKLLNEELDSNIINELIDKIDTDFIKEKLNKLISKKIKNSSSSIYFTKQKIINDLYNLGFDKEMVINELNNYEIKSNIENDFNKLLKKYNKLDKNELETKIRNKLYLKGYNIQEINEYIANLTF